MTEWKRKRPRRTKPHKKKKFHVFPIVGTKTLKCNKCKRLVEDTQIGRKAHGISCVRIQSDV